VEEAYAGDIFLLAITYALAGRDGGRTMDLLPRRYGCGYAILTLLTGRAAARSSAILLASTCQPRGNPRYGSC